MGLASAPPAPSKQPAATSGAKAAKDAPSAAGTRHQAAPPAERPAQPSAPPAGTGDSIAEYGALMDLHRAELKRDGFTLSFRKQSRPRLVPALRVPGAKPSKPAGTVAISDPDSQAAPKAPKTQRTLLQSVFWAGPPTSDVSVSADGSPASTTTGPKPASVPSVHPATAVTAAGAGAGAGVAVNGRPGTSSSTGSAAGGASALPQAGSLDPLDPASFGTASGAAAAKSANVSAPLASLPREAVRAALDSSITPAVRTPSADELSELAATRASLRSAIQTLRETPWDAVQTALDELQRENDRLRARARLQDEQTDTIKAVVARLERERAMSRARAEAAEAECDRLRSTVARLRAVPAAAGGSALMEALEAVHNVVDLRRGVAPASAPGAHAHEAAASAPADAKTPVAPASDGAGAGHSPASPAGQAGESKPPAAPAASAAPGDGAAQTSSPPPSPASGASSGEEEADGSEAEPAAPLARNATASGPSLAEVRERLEGLLEAVTDAQEREALHSGARTLCGVGAPGRTRGGRAGDWPPIDSRSAARGASRGDGSPDQSDEAGSEAVPGRARPGRHARSRSDGHSLAAAAEEAGAAAEAAMSAGHDSPPVASGIKSPTSASVAASVAAASAAGRRSATPEALARSEASARTAPLPQSPGPAGGMHAAGLHNRLRHSARPMADMLAGGDGRHGRGLSILAMDGGGIKGLVTLESLRQIERHTGRRIHELFDLIGGTSTGGLLAMLVGVKRMPLDDIPAIYETIRDKLASATGVFSELHRFASGVIYDDKMTADLLSGILGEGRLDEVPAWPKAFVVASACNSTPAQPYLFRTYELTRAASASSEFLGTSNCLMWEAVRATSSAPTFYNPAVVGGQRFVDGGILANNPAVIALAEAAVIWPHASVSCVVSLGTGMPSSRVHTARSALEWISYIVTDLCLSSHITHAVASSLLGDGQYFRVDPPMVDVSLSEVNKDVLAKMIDSVRAFLEQEPQQRLFRRVARILTARKPRMAAAPGVTQHCAASAAGARDSAAARSAPAGGSAAAAAAAASPPMSPLMAVASVGETPTPLDDAAASAAGLEADGVKPVFPEPAGAAAEAATTAPAERPPAAAPGTESAGKPAARSAQGGEATAQPGSPDSLAESPRSPASATRQQAASPSAAEDASQPAPPAKGTGSPGAV